MSELSPHICQGCRRDLGPSTPVSGKCKTCPPTQCADCHQMDSVTDPCVCWIDIRNRVLADIKSLFAATDDQLTIG